MVLAMPWDDPAVAALAAAREQQCFLKLFGLACPECFGVSNLAKQCLVSGLHHHISAAAAPAHFPNCCFWAELTARSAFR